MTACPPHFLPAVEIRSLGRVEYEPTWRAMQTFTARRGGAPDEIWLVEHPPIYTLGVAARAAHLPRLNNRIPVVKTDRGGQITYHGPGQIMMYVLLNLRRRALGVRALVTLLENTAIDLLADYKLAAAARLDAPGVYIDTAKIAAIGLRIRHGCCYHGLALNINMDLAPFSAIDPCGYPGLSVTQLRDFGVTDTVDTVAERLTQRFMARLTS